MLKLLELIVLKTFLFQQVVRENGVPMFPEPTEEDVRDGDYEISEFEEFSEYRFSWRIFNVRRYRLEHSRITFAPDASTLVRKSFEVPDIGALWCEFGRNAESSLVLI